MKIARPELPPSLSIPDDATTLFADEDLVSGVHIMDTWLTSGDLEKTNLLESQCTRVDFSHMQVARFDVTDCVFDGCNFTAAKFPDASWHRVMIESTRCSGLQITNGRLKDIQFKNAKLELVNFRFSRVENVLFENCVIDEVDFYDASLKNVTFVGCGINKITFASARMHTVDISASTVEGINGINSLRGVTMSYDQLLQLAPFFAAEAGITIK